MTPPASPATDHAAVPLPPPFVYAAGLVAGLMLERTVPSPNPPEAVARPAGIVATGAGVMLIASGAGFFRRHGTSVVPIKPTTALVDTGPYRFTRNPMYLGMACVQAGLSLRLQATWSLLLLAPVLVTIDRLVIAREERYLERKFGGEYRRYRARVRRWL